LKEDYESVFYSVITYLKYLNLDFLWFFWFSR